MSSLENFQKVSHFKKFLSSKKNLTLEYPKKRFWSWPSLISLIYFTVEANFRISLGLMKSNGCVALLNILHYSIKPLRMYF